MKERVCLIYNFAQHYRTNIFSLMDQQMDIDFVFGDQYLNVKKMDYKLLRHKVTEVKTIHLLGPFDWQCGVVNLIFHSYDKYIMLGKPMSISTWVTLVLGRLMGKKIYLWSHGWYGKESIIKTIVKKAFFGLAAGTMTYGNYARNLMIKEGLRADKITRIGNSLGYDSQIKLRNSILTTSIYKEHFGNDCPILIMIGRLNFRKHLDMLIKVIRELKDNDWICNLVLIGDGEDRHKLELLSNELEVDKQIWFYGPCYDEKKNAELLYNADLCVVPGDIGLTAMHAMMFGCPCITHNNYSCHGPEFEAIKEGYTGSFFKYKDAHNMAICIKRWLINNKENRKQIRYNCYNEIDNNWNPHIQVELIKKAINYD